MMKILMLQIRGDIYKVDENGNITQKHNDFSEQWKFLGVSFHHWRNGIDRYFERNADPKKYIKGILWDLDHGTVRRWGGSYHGKLPRITNAWYEE